MIKWILIIVAVLIVLGYLGFDVRKAIESPTTQSNLEYAKEATVYIWTKYLAKPAKFIWELFIEYVWDPLVGFLHDHALKEMKLNTSSIPDSGYFALS